MATQFKITATSKKRVGQFHKTQDVDEAEAFIVASIRQGKTITVLEREVSEYAASHHFDELLLRAVPPSRKM